ncbi:MAG: acyl-CoA thioesterase [Actinobacteria bacterium]|nr:acyl-CoA thioesterase [Actinomycetota bacterium]
MEGFPFVHEEVVRWRDLDSFGHVNNAVYLTYLEQSRFAYLEHLGLVREQADMAMILARVEIDFRSPLAAGERFGVGVRPARIGTKSFALEHELRSGERLVASARGVLVGYDYGSGETVAIPEPWRKTLSA